MSVASKLKDPPRVRYRLLEFINKDLMYPVYQPIIDICRNNVLGYEVLTRGHPPMESPGHFFEAAKEHDLSWEIDEACRMTFFRDLAVNPDFHQHRFFINVLPSVFTDERFHRCFSANTIHEIGIKPEQIVIEITEREHVPDQPALERSSKYFKSQGFAIALDDVGSGHSGLKTLSICTPDYMKLDMSLIRNISSNTYNQHMVRFLCEFASQVQAKIIAEGVETYEELLTLLRLGVRNVQGFLFSHPLKQPSIPDPSIMAKVRIAWNEFHYDDMERLDGLASLVIRGKTIEKNTISCESLHNKMKKEKSYRDHIVILDNGKPCGLLTPQSFFLKTGGAFGYPLFQKRLVDEIAKSDFLKVRCDSSVRTLSKLAMERCSDDIYDPVVVIDQKGFFLGTVTMKRIIARAGELEVEKAMNTNPLSGLPGNRHIEKWIYNYQKKKEHFTLIYVDLDHFKQYNDRYGFLCGDKLIQAAANILTNAMDSLPSGSRVAHIGGDDFVCVCPGNVNPEVLEGICVNFDIQKKKLFSPDDIKKGYYEGLNRNDELAQIPIVTMSLAVIDSNRLDPNIHAARIAEIAASLKHKVKQNTQKYQRSSFLFERRSYF